MREINLKGWNVGVKRQPITVAGANGEGPKQVDGWALVFEEVVPVKTGDTITFAFGEEVRDHIVRGLTGIVLPAGDPRKL